jgi:Xaa-Pro dipeptidase
MTDKRLEHIFSMMVENNLDAVVLNPGSSLTYLTGLHFHLMERPTVLILRRSSNPVIILPGLEIGKLDSSRLPLTPVTFSDDPSLWQKAFGKAAGLCGLNDCTIGVEATKLRFLELDLLQKAAPLARFVDAQKTFAQLRIQKDSSEVACMQKAVDIAQEALRATLPMIKVGSTEKEIASELVVNMLRMGNDPALPFAPIVSGGPNSANPHATPSERKLCEGDMLVIDWGASYNGYFSDLTRTFAMGKVDDEMAVIHDTVLAANEAGRKTGRPGIAAGKVDDAARGVIEKAGYDRYFTHRTGHGLGMEEHETPYIFAANNQILNEGMVYTVEPGIYLPGKGGVRIEDDVVVTAEGTRSLSDFPRELTILS